MMPNILFWETERNLKNDGAPMKRNGKAELSMMSLLLAHPCARNYVMSYWYTDEKA